MPAREIAELTGASEERVKGVIESPLAGKVAAELNSWLKRKARPAAAIEQERTRGDRRAPADIMQNLPTAAQHQAILNAPDDGPALNALARECGVSLATIGRIRSGHLKLTREEWQTIRDAPPGRGVNARLAREKGFTPAWIGKLRRG